MPTSLTMTADEFETAVRDVEQLNAEFTADGETPIRALRISPDIDYALGRVLVNMFGYGMHCVSRKKWCRDNGWSRWFLIGDFPFQFGLLADLDRWPRNVAPPQMNYPDLLISSQIFPSIRVDYFQRDIPRQHRRPTCRHRGRDGHYGRKSILICPIAAWTSSSSWLNCSSGRISPNSCERNTLARSCTTSVLNAS